MGVNVELASAEVIDHVTMNYSATSGTVSETDMTRIVSTSYSSTWAATVPIRVNVDRNNIRTSVRLEDPITVAVFIQGRATNLLLQPSDFPTGAHAEGQGIGSLFPAFAGISETAILLFVILPAVAISFWLIIATYARVRNVKTGPFAQDHPSPAEPLPRKQLKEETDKVSL